MQRCIWPNFERLGVDQDVALRLAELDPSTVSSIALDHFGLDAAALKERIKELHSSNQIIAADEIDLQLLGTTSVGYDQAVFDTPDDCILTDVHPIKVRYPQEITWGPGRKQIWSDYNIARAVARRFELTEDDAFYDLGSGYGRLPLYAGITTAAKCVGIELVEERAALTAERTFLLDLPNVETKIGNIRNHDYSDGTAFYMYQPFSSETYQHVVDELERIADDHTIQIALRINNPLISSNPRFAHAGTEAVRLEGHRTRVDFYESR